VDYLVESIFYPNRKIKEGYHAVVLETQDGQELSGILVRETTSNSSFATWRIRKSRFRKQHQEPRDGRLAHAVRVG